MRKINGKNVVGTPEVSVSPNFTLPPGLDEGRYLIEDTDGDSGFELLEIQDSGDEEIVIYEIENDGGPDFSSDNPLSLSAPESILVKSQTVRFAPDGKQVVDVVLTVADVDGAQNYEVRVSKQ